VSKRKRSTFRKCFTILALIGFSTSACSEFLNPVRTTKDVINIFSDQNKLLYIFKRNTNVNYNITGLDRFQSNQIISRILLLANIIGVDISASQTPNLGIIVSDDLFDNEKFNENRAIGFGIPKVIMDGLEDKWNNSKNCSTANSTWGEPGIGLSLIVVLKNQSEEEIFRCIDRSLIESFGLNTLNLASCAKNCFESAYPYDVKAAFMTISKCELYVKSNIDISIAYKEFSNCFWDEYKKEAK
jgi:hypothetical protein